MRSSAFLTLAVLAMFHAFENPRVQGAPGVVPGGDRILGISVAPAEDGDYPRAFAVAKSVGMQSITLSLDWNVLEPQASKYDDTLLTIASEFYPPQGVSVDLILRPIDTDRVELPADLSGKALDSPEVIARFERLLDHVLNMTPHLTIHSLAIGNEVDDQLGMNFLLWKQYQTFYNAVSSYGRRKRPGLKVGVVATFPGLTGRAKSNLIALNQQSDIIMATYYPLNSDFTVENPTVVSADFDRLTALYPGRQIEMTEVGYPSSNTCKSSEALQAQFVVNVFRAWDAHSRQIKSITFSWLTDLSPDAVAGYARYYGVDSQPFAEFLRTLGLRTYPGHGQDKLAFTALKSEARKRGW